MSLQVTRRNAPPFVRRFPAGEAERGRQQARLLAAAAHPAVTELLAVREQPDGSLELWLRRLPGPDLAHLPYLALEEACGLGAAVATTVADLHHLGIVHGDLAGPEVLLGEDGQPVLCGFGRAEFAGDDAEGDLRRADDVAALVRLVVALLPGEPGSRTERRLRGRLRRCRSAAGVGSAVLDAVPAARLPVPGAAGASIDPRPPTNTIASHHPGWRRRRWWYWWSATLLTAAVATAWALHARHEARSTSQWAIQACPAVDAGCGPLPRPGGVLVGPGGRYLLGRTGDVVVLGRWTCSIALPADLRPTTGQVWVFGAWPARTGSERGRLLRTVAGARSLRVLPGPRRCDLLVVARSGGRPALVLDPRAATP